MANSRLIDSIRLSLDALERADAVVEVTEALREADNRLSEIVEFVENGYSWEL